MFVFLPRMQVTAGPNGDIAELTRIFSGPKKLELQSPSSLASVSLVPPPPSPGFRMYWKPVPDLGLSSDGPGSLSLALLLGMDLSGLLVLRILRRWKQGGVA